MSVRDDWTDEEVREEFEVLEGERDALMQERDELHKLVRHLRECVMHTVCVMCPYVDASCDYDSIMRELGIEVEE